MTAGSPAASCLAEHHAPHRASGAGRRRTPEEDPWRTRPDTTTSDRAGTPTSDRAGTPTSDRAGRPTSDRAGRPTSDRTGTAALGAGRRRRVPRVVPAERRRGALSADRAPSVARVQRAVVPVRAGTRAPPAGRGPPGGRADRPEEPVAASRAVVRRRPHGPRRAARSADGALRRAAEPMSVAPGASADAPPRRPAGGVTARVEAQRAGPRRRGSPRGGAPGRGTPRGEARGPVTSRLVTVARVRGRLGAAAVAVGMRPSPAADGRGTRVVTTGATTAAAAPGADVTPAGVSRTGRRVRPAWWSRRSRTR